MTVDCARPRFFRDRLDRDRLGSSYTWANVRNTERREQFRRNDALYERQLAGRLIGLGLRESIMIDVDSVEEWEPSLSAAIGEIVSGAVRERIRDASSQYRNGLASGFYHYITHGSEFDQHVAHSLLGPEGMEL